MNREIKFRVWNGKKMNYNGMNGAGSGAMVLVLTLDGCIHEQSLYGLENKPISGGIDGLQLMQFTGLQDKNGNDIYEGDIVGENRVGLPVEVVGKIVFDTDYMYLVVHKENGGFEYLTEFFTSIQKAYVVGNLYENPELLKPNTP